MDENEIIDEDDMMHVFYMEHDYYEKSDREFMDIINNTDLEEDFESRKNQPIL